MASKTTRSANLRAGLALAAWMSALAPGEARALDQDEIDDFVLNATWHTLLHETGHALIDQFQLPVIGQEEDAADAFATLEILAVEDDPAPIIIDGALAFIVSHEMAEEAGEEPAYYGEHDLDAQRGIRMICHAYGQDPDEFAEAAEMLDIPEDRLETCQADSELANDSWNALIEDALLGADDKPSDVRLIIEDVEGYEHLAKLIRDTETGEALRAHLSETYAWPETLELVFDSCDEPNAYYDPETVRITACYELMDWYAAAANRAYGEE